MKKLKTKLPWALAAILLIVFLTYGFWPEPIQVEVTRVTRGSLEVTVNDDGETRIREKYVVSAPVTGKLLRIRLHAGDMVEAGVTELALIEPSSPDLLDARTQAEAEARLRASEAAVNQAEAALLRTEEAMELANHEYERAQELIDQNAISQSEFDSAEHRQRIALADVRTADFAVQVTRFELEHARAAASRYEINGSERTSNKKFRLISPISGQVLRVFLEDAGAVLVTTSLLELGDPQDLEIEIDVLSTDAVKINPGDKLYIEHWGGPQTLHGVVRVVEPSAFLKVSALGVEEKRVNVIADFIDPWSCRQTLGDGFRVEARIIVDRTAEDSLKTDAGALFRQGESWCVYRIVGNETELCEVSVGATNGLETEITDGLAAGDILILHPSNKIQDGTYVTVGDSRSE